MKKIVTVGSGVAAGVMLGPVAAGAMGFQATDGFDGADVVSILLGLFVFFLMAWLLPSF